MQKITAMTRRLLVTIVLSGLALSVQAQENLLSNSGFASNFVGWSENVEGTATWVNVDSEEDSNSGAAMIGNEGPWLGFVPVVLFQCIEVQPQQDLEFGGDLVVPDGQPEGTAAYIYIEQFLNSSCEGNFDSFTSVSSAAIGDWNSVSGSFTTSDNVQSVRLGLATFKPTEEDADALSIFDNVFLRAEGDGTFEVNPSMSASWFNPDQEGHGIMIHLLNETQAWMCWFAFDNDGNPVWICAFGEIQGDSLVFEEAFVVEGGAFPPNFDEDLITNIPWGTITVTFTGCNAGEMTWTTSLEGFQSGSMSITRLTSLWGVTCN